MTWRPLRYRGIRTGAVTSRGEAREEYVQAGVGGGAGAGLHVRFVTARPGPGTQRPQLMPTCRNMLTSLRGGAVWRLHGPPQVVMVSLPVSGDRLMWVRNAT